MTSHDPIGREGPYEKRRRRARTRGVGYAMLALALGIAGYMFLVKLGLAVAP